MTESKSGKSAGSAGKKGPGRPPKGEEFTFGELEFREAEMPKPASSNPFSKALGESYEYDAARAVTIPAAGVNRAAGLLRRAADELKIGVSIVVGEPLENEDGSPTGMVELVFKGKPRRKRKGKGDQDAPAAENASAAEDTGPANGDSDPSRVAPGYSPEGAPAGTVSEPVAS